MGSSKKSSTSTYDLAGLKEYRQPLVGQIPRLESSYQEMKQNPLIGQAQGYTSDVLAGKYLTPENNPYLMNYANAAMKQFQSGQNALMARAGRGNLSGGDTQKMMGEGMTSALVAPLLQQYNIERGYQDTAGTRAPAMTLAAGAPEEWLQQQLIAGSNTGKSGTTKTTETSTPSIGQQIGAAGMAAIGLLSGNPMMAMQGMGGLAGQGGGGQQQGMGGGLPWAPQGGGGGYRYPWQ